MTGAMPTAGLSQLSCRVVSVQNDVAKVRDQLNREIDVRRDISRAKGAPPAVGEQWIIARDLFGDWTFAAIVGMDTNLPMYVCTVGSAAERNALSAAILTNGFTVYRRDLGYHEVWSAGVWTSAPRAGVIKHIDPTTDLPIPNLTTTIDTPCQITFTKLAGREYKFTYTTRYSQTNLSGTLSVNFRAAGGAGPILVTSNSFLNYIASANGANNDALSVTKYIPSSLGAGVYTVGVTLFAGSGGGASIAYGGVAGDGRTFICEDMTPSQQ